ncbi:microtubule-associated protein 10 [Patagioenas fasciata monilis]|uniref:Microtubule-associated protein 10 n=1 Tax=Patagioenas fasciata monilis TaxID=372326 RepID=A0A1V4JKM5_PATFA|nr:microtubule-associated protein 10 [Patagioenas fasciata monilis]
MAAADAEGLFALELLVEAVRVAAPGPALRPAVALRLLDFPTLLLRPAAPPLRPGQAFPFGRGKRCLFRWRRGSLCAALRRRPLRALLLALPAGLAPGTPRLLGSCSVSLAPAAAELLQRPGATGSCGRRGCFPLCDSAGRLVGDLVLGYRLSSLEAAEEPPPPSPASPHAATPAAASPEPWDEEEEGEELEGNIFCPPVLYYSREPADPLLPPAAAAAAGQWQHVEAWRPQEQEQGQSPPRPSAGPSLLHPASLQRLHSTLGQLPLLSALLAELSVLTHSATPAAVHPHLAWLYQAPADGGMASQPPSCSSAFKPAEAPVGPGGRGGAAGPRFQQDQQETISPGSSWTGKGSKKAVPKGEPSSERNCKTKENRPPRRKLLYGLTNTLRLRLQQTNPDKLIIHEKREQYRKKQMEMLKKRSPLSKRKLLRNAGEQNTVSYRHCSKGDSSKQNNQSDKAVQTSLQNSVPTEYVSVTGDVFPDLQKQAVESLVNNDEISSKEHPCKVTTAPLLEETVLKSAHKEEYAKAQLPTAFPSDGNAKGSNEEAVHLIHRKTMEHDDTSVVSDHKPSPSRSVENNSEFIYSDDFASPENTIYSENFSSAECTDRDLEVLDSSPEPLWHESPKQGWSDTEPESSRSRISKTSQRAESTSDLLPVPSVSSPVQSLKRKYDLKTTKKTSSESVDSVKDASIQARLLDEDQISKKQNRDDQQIKQASTLRSTQVSSDTDLNKGKGQTSAGRSQPVTQVSSCWPSNVSDLELSVLENSMSDKEEDFLGKLHVPNQCKDISELVINKLPGYTV